MRHIFLEKMDGAVESNDNLRQVKQGAPRAQDIRIHRAAPAVAASGVGPSANSQSLSVVIPPNPPSQQEIFQNIRASGHPDPSEQQITPWSKASAPPALHLEGRFGTMVVRGDYDARHGEGAVS